MSGKERGGIYILTFPDGTWYVGQTARLASRKSRHKTNLNQGNASRAITDAWIRNNRSFPVFEIIQYEEDKSKRSLLESSYLSTRLQSEPLTCLNNHRVNLDVEEFEMPVGEKRKTIIAEMGQLNSRLRQLIIELEDIDDQ